MKKIVRTGGGLLSVGCLMLVGCDSTEKTTTTSPGTLSAIDVGEQSETRLDYLVSRYDADGDGAITAEEYTREGDQFDRLDRNADGVLNADDFASGRGGMQAQIEAMQAQRAVAAHFQDDDANDSMTKDELVRGIAAYDSDRDGAIGADEFAASAEDRKVELPGDESPMMSRMLGDGDPYAMILKKVDEDEDGVLGNDELVAYFDANASDGAMAIRNPMGGNRNRRRGGGGGAQADAEPQDGAMVGEMAPDFSLRPPDGGETVTLSSFRDNLPVALIFGSYT